MPDNAVGYAAEALDRAAASVDARPLRIMHVALQGALRWRDVEYGRTADTGGHIKYVLELVEALARSPRVHSVDIVVRAFRADGFSSEYDEPLRNVSPKVRVVRLPGTSPDYVTKEEMWAEHQALGNAMLEHIDRFGPPDLVHAHYADAGALAARLKRERGIPFIFTGHSLGAVKRKAYRQSGRENPDTGLDRRVEMENAVVRDADLVIASSRDEAELQYTDYPNYDPGRARIVPPGIDRTAFAGGTPQSDEEAVGNLLRPFLRDPSKPMVLAIARPVTKKNLAGLVRAFGRSPDLRKRANLVLIAGTRDALRDSESDRNIREILELIDTFDLYGSIAYPKNHSVDQIPALYRYAASTGGVFVNPALNEPFGLTLLEAASVGLPVVATNRGGPNDIVGHLRNGTLVAPENEMRLAEAMLELIEDKAAWSRAARSGIERSGAYSWDEHASRYLDLARAVTRATAERRRPARAPRRMLATDIDGTLIGCAASLGQFAEWASEREDLLYGVATGRSLHAALDLLEREGAPLPPLMIVAVGSEIYRRDPSGAGYVQDRDWTRHIDVGWHRAAIDEAVMQTEGFVRQPALEQRSHKLSYFVDCSAGADAAADHVARLEARLRADGLDANVIHSHGELVDVLPPRADKGTAVAFAARAAGIDPSRIFVSGDSGNDIAMLGSFANSIIVANHRDAITERPELAHAYRARRPFAAGIMEGVEHYEHVQERPVMAAE